MDRFVHGAGTFYWTYDFPFSMPAITRKDIRLQIVIVHVSSVFNINSNFSNELLFMKFYDQKHMRRWNRKYWPRVYLTLHRFIWFHCKCYSVLRKFRKIKIENHLQILWWFRAIAMLDKIQSYDENDGKSKIKTKKNMND